MSFVFLFIYDSFRNIFYGKIKIPKFNFFDLSFSKLIFTTYCETPIYWMSAEGFMKAFLKSSVVYFLLILHVY